MTTHASPLRAALSEREPDEFLESLATLDPRYAQVSLAELPEPLRMFTCVALLYQDAHHEGIWKFLSQEEGSLFHETAAYCRTLGAARAVAYLDEVARAFPRGRVPVEIELRSRVVERLGDGSRAKGAADPFAVLDEKHRDAMAELEVALRGWVTENRQDLERVIGTLPGAPSGTPSEVAHLEQALGTLEEAVTRTLAGREATRAELHEAAVRSGMLPWSPAENLAALERFLAAAAVLTDDEWRLVASRRLKHPRKADAARTVANHVVRVLMDTDLIGRAVFESVLRRMDELRTPLSVRTEKLPVSGQHDGKTIGVRHGAWQAIADVTRIMEFHDWVVLTPEGSRVAHAT